MSFLRRRFLLVVVAALVFALATKLVEWTAEAWFFASVGQLTVYQRIMAARSVLFVLGAAWCLLVLKWNLRHARRVASRRRAAPVERLLPLRDKRTLDHYRPFWGRAILAIVLLLSGSYAAVHWLVVLRCFAAAPTGTLDPVLHRDLSFYLFTLPALNFLWTFVDGTLWLALVASGGFYVYEEILEAAGRHWRITGAALRHLAALGGALLLWKAAGYGLSACNLLTARGAPSGGLDWTALHISLLLLPALAVLALGAAWSLRRPARRGNASLVWRVLLLWVGANLTIGTLVPFAVRHFYAVPQRAALELPILQMRRAASARAMGLDTVQAWPHQVATDDALRAAAAGFPRWREDALLRYLNMHQRRGDYIFNSLHLDAVNINGEARPVFVAPREPLPDSGAGDDWLAPHGFGVVLCDAARRTPDGAPVIYPSPPLAHGELVFGELPESFNDWPVPPDDHNALPDVMTRRVVLEEQAPFALLPPGFPASGGVVLDSSLRRLLLAWRFFDGRLLHAPPGARVAWDRRVLERCAALAPFLLFEEPRLVLVNGRLLWLVNAHSVSDSYPLAAALSGTRLNAMRHVAVAVVGAFDGSVTFYRLQDDDPALETYRRLFPTLFHDWREMPSELRRHLVYSPLLLSAQADLWARLLAPSPQEVATGDLWQTATLRQPGRWPQKSPVALSVQCTLSPQGFACGQLFTLPAPDDDKSVLNGPLAGMLWARLDAASPSLHPLLWQWRSPRPETLRLPASSAAPGAKEELGEPESLVAEPVGDTLLLRFQEGTEEMLSGAVTSRPSWLLQLPATAHSVPILHGDSLDTVLAGWWLRRAVRTASARTKSPGAGSKVAAPVNR